MSVRQSSESVGSGHTRSASWAELLALAQPVHNRRAAKVIPTSPLARPPIVSERRTDSNANADLVTASDTLTVSSAQSPRPSLAMVSSTDHNQIYARTQDILAQVSALKLNGPEQAAAAPSSPSKPNGTHVAASAQSNTLSTQPRPASAQFLAVNQPKHRQNSQSSSNSLLNPNSTTDQSSSTNSDTIGPVTAQLGDPSTDTFSPTILLSSSQAESHPQTQPIVQPMAYAVVTEPQNQQPQYHAAQQLPLLSSNFSLPITSPPQDRPSQILLINPTSTSSLSDQFISTLRPILPAHLELTAYTAPYPSPTAIESSTDAILSTETCVRDLARHSTNNGETVLNFDGLLVGSCGHHPLIDTLRESYDVPVIGVLEASLYVARMLGARFGILVPSTRSKIQIEDAVRGVYKLGDWCVGVESLGCSTMDLMEIDDVGSTAASWLNVSHGNSNGSSNNSRPTSSEYSVAIHASGSSSGDDQNDNSRSNLAKANHNNPPGSPTHLQAPPAMTATTTTTTTPTPRSLSRTRTRTRTQVRSRKEILTSIHNASRALLHSGADLIILGSEAFCKAELVRAVKDAVRNEDDGRRTVNVIECVEAGVMVLHSLVGLGVPTSKKGVYLGEREGRRRRGQNWL